MKKESLGFLESVQQLVISIHNLKIAISKLEDNISDFKSSSRRRTTEAKKRNNMIDVVPLSHSRGY